MNEYKIKNPKHLKYFPIKNIDKKSIDLLINFSKEESKSTQDNFHYILMRFNAFLVLTNKKVNYIKLTNTAKYNKIFSEFIMFYKQGAFNESELTSKNYISMYSKVINRILNINNKFKLEKTLFDIKTIELSRFDEFNKYSIEGNRSLFCNLIKYNEVNGIEETNKLLNKIKIYSKNADNIDRLTASNFKILENILSINNNKLNIINEYSFLETFFKSAEERKLCLNTKKKEWNNFTKFYEYVFSIPKETLIRIPETNKKGFLTKIKKVNGKDVKTKLITDIPLEVTDSEAISLLISKINKDVELVNEWADYEIERAYKSFKNDYNMRVDEYGKSVKEFMKGRSLPQATPLNNVINPLSLVRNTFLLAVQMKLVNEHPQITESFLQICEFKGIKETDSGTYLVSHKLRKGKNSQQQILLNKNSKRILDIYIEMTKDMREYLKKNNDNSYKKLFICIKSQGLTPFYPKKIDQDVSNIKRVTANDKYNFFNKNKGFSHSDSLLFIKRFSLTKLRASRGVQIYIETKSTTKMAEALGHHKYDASLLSHYLPEPIIDFFQKRWIKLFQKSIICEALKDSSFLLKATKFNTMKELETFLENHELKNLPDIDNSVDIDDNFKEIYINFNKEISVALKTIERKVKNSKTNISEKTKYWSDFSVYLHKEIEVNNEYVHLRSISQEAEEQIKKDYIKEDTNE